VSSTPINHQAAAVQSMGVAGVALVISPRSFPLDVLLQIRGWQVADALMLSLTRQATTMDHDDEVASRQLVSMILHELLTQGIDGLRLQDYGHRQLVVLNLGLGVASIRIDDIGSPSILDSGD
jgi:hypothetical protein